MEKPMKEFLDELANLMEQHGVELDVITNDGGWYTSVEGVEFSMRSKYDSEENTLIGTDADQVIPFDNVTAQDIRNVLEHVTK